MAETGNKSQNTNSGDATIVVPQELARANAAKDAATLAAIQRDAERSNTEMKASILNAQAHNPAIDPRIFQDIMDSRDQNLQWYVKELAEINRVDPTTGAPRSADWLKARKIKAECDTDVKILQEVRDLNYRRHPEARTTEEKARLDNQVAAAFDAIRREEPSKGIFSSVTKSFYDTEKGGMQYGGIIGAIVGLIGGTVLTGGTGGGFMGIISTILLTVAGVWAGNKIAETYASHNNAPATTPVNTPEKAVGAGKAKEVEQNTDLSKIPAVVQGAEKVDIKGIFAADAGSGSKVPATTPNLTTSQQTTR